MTHNLIVSADRLNSSSCSHPHQKGILAASPSMFEGCGNTTSLRANPKILFEQTNKGLMILIHSSLDRQKLQKLLDCPNGPMTPAVGLIIPLWCSRSRYETSTNGNFHSNRLYLRLGTSSLEKGKWRRLGIIEARHGDRPTAHTDFPSIAYTNEYIRIYVQDDWDPQNQVSKLDSEGNPIPFHKLLPETYLHISSPDGDEPFEADTIP